MAKISKYKDARFEDSLQLIRPALEWAEKQDVERLRRFLVENANIPLYCFSSGGSSASNDYLALLYETNKGMAKSLTPLAMASLSDEALKSAKIIITNLSLTSRYQLFLIRRTNYYTMLILLLLQVGLLLLKLLYSIPHKLYATKPLFQKL